MENDIEKPPVFKNWSTLYWIVIILHIGLITVFTLITKAYS